MKRYTFLLVAFLFISCGKNVIPELGSADEEFKLAVELFNQGKYKKAIEYFKTFFNRYPGSHWIDDAQFYYAESYYKLKIYDEALNEFQFLVNNFPNSSWSEQGLLRIAQCMERMSPIPQRDQTLTEEAIKTYEMFIKKYPYSKWLDEAKEGKKNAEEKLNKKLLEIGEMYLKVGIKEAAVFYLEKVAEKSERWKDKANLLLGDIALSNNSDSLAISYYEKVEGELKEKAQKKLSKLKK
ncbi:MAG: outer membrane protein assembly factor BamD [candidate division WOR-3 bacterium]